MTPEGSAAGLRVAVDAMGGDDAPDAIVRGAALAVRDGVPVLLVGDTARITPLLPDDVQIPIVHAPEVVEMEEAAALSVRRKTESSIRVGLQLVADGKALAMVSCGHTGASFVGAVLVLGVLDTVERPAIATVLPRSDGGQLILLDIGANVDCKPEQLACFAQLGAAWAEVRGVENPRVGLLSNGEEGSKGNEQVRAAHPLIAASGVHFVGNMEPSAAFAGACDVLVCDGFVGNVLVKGVEGAAEVVQHLLREHIKSSVTARAGALLMRGAFTRFQNQVRWDAHGGGVFLGTKGVVVVGHGRANAEAVHAAICAAHRVATGGLVASLQSRLSAQSKSA